MKRLMDLLTRPLAAWTSLGISAAAQQQAAVGGAGSTAVLGGQQYAEWVGVRQRVALLQAHAQCATIERHGGDELTVSIVRRAHKPHRCACLTCVVMCCAVLAGSRIHKAQ